MKAVLYTKYGQPDVLHLTETQKPVPQDDEILVKVHAASVNRTDCANLTAKPFIMRFFLGLYKPRKKILGTEFAGRIEKVGRSVKSFKTGDRIFGFDDGIISSYAEYLVISKDNAISVVPENIDFTEAATCLEGAHYAYNFINKLKLSKKSKVIVNGASGGIGSATVQLLKYYGISDITAVCTAESFEIVKLLGANKLLDYKKENFTMSNDKYDVVFDSVGKSSFSKCRNILKPGGVYMSSELGKMAQNIWYALFTFFFGSIPFRNGKKVKFPYPPDRKRTVLFLKDLIEAGQYKSVIDRSWPLEKIADAFRYVLKEKKIGNIAITIDHHN